MNIVSYLVKRVRNMGAYLHNFAVSLTNALYLTLLFCTHVAFEFADSKQANADKQIEAVRLHVV